MAADGSVLITTDLNINDAEKKLKKLTGDIEKTERGISSMTKKRDAADQKGVLGAAELDAENAKLQEIKDRLQDIRNMSRDKVVDLETRENLKAKIPAVQQEYADQQTRVRMLQTEWNKTVSSVERYDQKIAEAKDRLDQQKTAAGVLVQEIDQATVASSELSEEIDQAKQSSVGMGEAINQAGSYLDRFTNRIKKLMARAFVFTLISSALRSMRDWMWKAVKTNNEATAAMAKLKGALLTLAQPLVNVVIPAFTALVNVLTKIALVMANIVSKLFGTTVEQSAEAAKNLNDEMNALEGVGDAAKKAGKSMASFDEINQVGDTSSSSETASSETIAPDFDTSFITGELDDLTAILGGALLALGAILTFSGANIPLGIGMMAVGATALGITIAENWGGIEQALQGPIGAVAVLVSGAILALGALLAFSGVNIPLGISLMAAGSVGLGATIAVNWGAISENLEGEIGLIVGLISGALLAIGAILLFTGASIPFGLGFMVAGAVGLAASIAANWNTVQNSLRGPVGAVLALVSSALLVLGVVLLFTGAWIPLGLGLIVAGAVGLAASIDPNFSTAEDALRGPIGVVTALVSSALLAIGAILLFTGAGTALGLGLIVVGAAGLASAASANWDTVQNAMRGPIGAVTAIVSEALLILGVILLFTGAGIPVGLGLILAGVAGLAATIAPNWNYILDNLKLAWGAIASFWNSKVLPALKSVGRMFADNVINPLIGMVEGFINFFIKGLNWLIERINQISFEVPDWVPGIGGKRVGFSLNTFNEISLPRLAQGAVIPPNREFMAVLGDQKRGTNIEAPADLIRQMVMDGIRAAGGSAGGRDLTVIMQLDRQTLGRVVYRLNNEETQRVGVSFEGVHT